MCEVQHRLGGDAEFEGCEASREWRPRGGKKDVQIDRFVNTLFAFTSLAPTILLARERVTYNMDFKEGKKKLGLSQDTVRVRPSFLPPHIPHHTLHST